MEASGSNRRRVDIGFYGTQVLSVRISQESYDALRQALESTEGRVWHQVETEDSVFSVDLDKIVYVRLEIDRERVGF
jgi:hypothetical protein